MPSLKTLRGIEIYVSVDGVFRATVGPDRLEADTLAALEAQILRGIAKAKIRVEIPITRLGWKLNTTSKYAPAHWQAGPGVQHVTLTGIHANGNVLAKDDLTGERLQYNSSYFARDEYARRLTEAEVEEYLTLYHAQHAAQKALEAFHERVMLTDQPKELIQAAMAQKADDPGEAEIGEPQEDPR